MVHFIEWGHLCKAFTWVKNPAKKINYLNQWSLKILYAVSDNPDCKVRLDNISQTSHRLSELTGLPKLCLTLVCVPHLLVPIVSTAVAGGFLQLCTSGVWYLVVSEWSQNTAGVSPLCAPHGPEQVSSSDLVMGIFQIAEFQSEFWHFLSLWPAWKKCWR